MKLALWAVACATAAMLCGCVNDSGYHPSSGEKVRISQYTFNAFKQYQATIGSTRPGAFAVSKSGRRSYYYYCEETVCVSGSAYGQQAVKACSSGGEPCYLFASNNDIKYDYEIVP